MKLFILISLISPLFPAFKDTTFSLYQKSLAGAVIVRDVNSILVNPACISLVEGKQFALSYIKPYFLLEGINLNKLWVAFAYPTLYANIGVSVSHYGLLGFYQENMFLAAFSQKIISDFKFIKSISAGISLKYLGHEYRWDEEIRNLADPITQKSSAYNFSADAGLLIEMFESLKIGISYLNINQPDVGLIEKDLVPLEAKFNISYGLNKIAFFEVLTPSFMFSFRNSPTAPEYKFAAGIECQLKMFSVRFGLNNSEIGFGASFSKFISHFEIELIYGTLLLFQLPFPSQGIGLMIKFLI